MSIELRYCEECGDIIRQKEGEAVSIGETFVCGKCRQDGPGAEVGSSPRAGGQGADEAVEPEELELFSKDTILMERKKLEGLELETPLKLTESDPGIGSGIGSGKKSPSAGSVGLRSEASPARDRNAPAETAKDGPLTLVSGKSGAESPAATARRIVFRCVHCKATLSIRPVRTSSRLTCPYCSGHIYVSEGGQLSSKPPSIVVREGSGAVPKIRPESVALKKEPSSVSLRRPDSSRAAPPARSAPSPEGASPAIVERMTPGHTAGGAPRRATSGRQAQRASRPDARKAPATAPRAERRGSADAAHGARSSAGSFRGAAPRPERGTESAAARRPGSSRGRARALPESELRPLGASGGAEAPSSLLDLAQAPAGGVSSERALREGTRDRRRAPTTGARGKSLPPPGRLKTFLIKASWGVFVTAVLTAPVLLLAGFHHFAEATDGGAEVSSGIPAKSVFETFGRIARAGLQEILDLVR